MVKKMNMKEHINKKFEELAKKFEIEGEGLEMIFIRKFYNEAFLDGCEYVKDRLNNTKKEEKND